MARGATSARAVAIVLAGGLIAAFSPPAAFKVRVEVTPFDGYRIETPAVLEGPEGTRIRGAVCRTSSAAATAPGAIRIQRLAAAAAPDETVYARLSRTLSGRESGCAFYDVQTPWQLDPGEQLRVSAANAGR